MSENLSFDWQIEEFMIYCRSIQLHERTLNSYERALRLFQRWCEKQLNIANVDEVTDEDFKILISKLDRSYYHERRDFAMIMLMIDSSMRLGECSCFWWRILTLWLGRYSSRRR